MNPQSCDTIAERIGLFADRLTKAEHKLVYALLANYPVAGLSSITELAAKAGVSSSTVIRLARKLGFTGFPAFQVSLKNELSAQLRNPIASHDRWSSEAPEEHILNRFALSVLDNLRVSIERLDHREFDHIAELLAERHHTIHVTGGSITRILAEYFRTHLGMIRPGVSLLPAMPPLWPQYLLNVSKDSLLVVFDIRRYDSQIMELAKLAADRGATIILITDQWTSPISNLARHSLSLRIEVASNWDSSIVILFLIEALVAAVSNLHGPEARRRIQEMEEIFEAQRRVKR